MTSAKEIYGANLTAAFSLQPKDLYWHLQHLSNYKAMPQVLIYNSAPIYHLKEEVEAFNKSFNSIFSVSDFVLLTLHQMLTPFKKLSQIIVSELMYLKLLLAWNQTKLKVVIT